jgi:hypothetical protein
MVGAIGLALAVVLLQPTTRRPPATPSETVTPTAALIEVTPPPSPRTTPPGTPAPPPSEAVVESVVVVTPSPQPATEPTPSPDPALWRIEGTVVDEDGKPLESVCVVVGPHGCQRFSPHTDENGHYFLDVAHSEIKTMFDFYFELPGHATVWWQVTPNGPTEFNVVLRKG